MTFKSGSISASDSDWTESESDDDGAYGANPISVAMLSTDHAVPRVFPPLPSESVFWKNEHKLTCPTTKAENEKELAIKELASSETNGEAAIKFEECIICTNEINAGSIITIMDCNPKHIFHTSCVSAMVDRN